jgi:hypothetical protein
LAKSLFGHGLLALLKERPFITLDRAEIAPAGTTLGHLNGCRIFAGRPLPEAETIPDTIMKPDLRSVV